MTKWKVHVAPLSVEGWDGIVRVHLRGWSGFLGLLCVKFIPNVDSSLFRKGICEEIKLPLWIETLGLYECLSKDSHLGDLLGFDESGGMHGGWKPSTPQVWNQKQTHLET
jgi:hypothetical protein